MRKASLPVPHLVAIIFAILIIALLAYFLIRHFSEGETEMSYYECYAKFVQMCVSKKITKSKFLQLVKQCQQYEERLPDSCPI